MNQSEHLLPGGNACATIRNRPITPWPYYEKNVKGNFCTHGFGRYSVLACISVAVMLCILVEILVVALSCGFERPFYQVTISSYLSEGWKVSIPGMILVAGLIFVGMCYRHPLKKDGKVVIMNVVLLVLIVIACISLCGLTIFTNGHTSCPPLDYRYANLGTHLTFTNLCFVTLIFFEFLQTACLISDMTRGAIKITPYVKISLCIACVCLFNLVLWFCLWFFEGGQGIDYTWNYAEWLAVSSLWIYFFSPAIISLDDTQQ